MAYRNQTDDLLDLFFSKLHLFPQLTAIRCELVPFSHSMLAHIARVTMLKTLELEDCTVEANAHPPQVRVQNVSFRSHACPSTATPPRTYGWLDILDCESIQSLKIDFAKPLMCHLRGIATASSSQSPQSADEATRVRQHLQLLISHPTRLRELEIAPYVAQRQGLEVLPLPVDLPLLRVYKGPFPYWAGFALRDTMEVLRLRHLGDGYTDTRIVLCSLGGPTQSHLHSLTVRILDDPVGFLKKMKADYPQLREIRIFVLQVRERELLDALPSILPRSLKTLHLDISNIHKQNPRLLGFRRRLGVFVANPSLVKLSLNSGPGGKEVQWGRPPAFFLLGWVARLLLFFLPRNLRKQGYL
ncbi:hypothetical protein HWV62_34193 [Athelia sp. TMB]|nr:hypothetical protein HWV62_34193 [Athelia sp. TMB]